MLAGVVGVPALIPVWALALLAVFVWSAVMRRRGRGPSWATWLRWPPARWVFWPKVPRNGSADEKLEGIWARAAATIGRRPRWFSWVSTAVVLLVAAAFVTTLKADGFSQADGFTTKPESVLGQEELAKHFPAGSGNPAVIIANAAALETVERRESADVGGGGGHPVHRSASGPRRERAGQGRRRAGPARGDAQVRRPTRSPPRTRSRRCARPCGRVPGADAKVGGFTAINLDTQERPRRDRTVIIPIVLLVILLILMLLLRVDRRRRVLLVLTVVLSFVATLGACALVFTHLFHFAGADSSFPLFAFVFLVALGVDYNIFLMTRVREEALTDRHPARRS